MRRGLAAASLVAASLVGHAAPAPGPALLSDLSDETLRAVGAAPAGSPATVLDNVLRAATAFRFETAGLQVLTDRRWFEVASVEGEGAPVLELRRWPGDTALAFYEVPADGSPSSLPSGLKLGGKISGIDGWTVWDAELGTGASARPAVWAEATRTSRRLAALGLPGDAGFGPPGTADLREAILAIVRIAEVAERGAPAAPRVLIPELGVSTSTGDERKQSWQVLQAERFTIGLPPGLRAVRLDASFAPPRPMPYAAAWLRGRFTDRDGAAIAVGDGRRAGYVAMIDGPDEEWRAGVKPPLGAPRAESIDQAPLDAQVLEWTGASRAAVGHWKEPGFVGDWLVFRLLVGAEGVEIGLPVVAGWRSLALFWVPVTWRRADRPPAPPPIDPAARLGVHFDRLRTGEKAAQVLVEGTLTVGTLRLELPRGFWPVANLAAPDGLPVTILDASGETAGRIEALPNPLPSFAVAEGWTALPRPGARKAAALHVRGDGTLALVARAGSGYLLVPQSGGQGSEEAWRRMTDSAALIRGAAR